MDKAQEGEVLDRMEISFMIRRAPSSLNSIFKMHWSERKREQSDWDQLVFSQWMICGRLVFLNPVKITYRVGFEVKRKRDFDNYIGGTKFITDALKRSFLTRDDAEWLRGIEVQFCEGKNVTEVIIQEVE